MSHDRTPDAVPVSRDVGARDVVKSSAWDGSVRQVKDWLEANAHDARSIEYVEWSPVERLRGGYAVRCKFRAKNAFGAYVLHNKLFMLDQNGTVLDMKDY